MADLCHRGGFALDRDCDCGMAGGERSFVGGDGVAKIVRKELLYFAAATLLIILILPFLPTTLLIQPQSLAVVGDQVHMTRTVTLPVGGRYKHEFERLTPPPNVPLVCFKTGVAHYEVRGLTPIVYDHDCDFGSDSAEWLFRSCWQAEAIFGIFLRPVCLTTVFRSNADHTDQQIEMMQRELNTLKGVRNED